MPSSVIIGGPYIVHGGGGGGGPSPQSPQGTLSPQSPEPVLSPLGSPAPGSPLWTPAELANLTAWWDADDASTLTLAGTSPERVSALADKSGNQWNMLEVGSSGPLVRTGLINGLNALDFDVSTRGLKRVPTTDSPIRSPINLTTGDFGAWMVWSKEFTEGGIWNGLFQVTDSSSWGQGWHFGALQSTPDALRVAVNNYVDNQIEITDSPVGTGIGNAELAGLTWDEGATEITGYANGVSQGSNTAETGAIIATDEMYLGCADPLGNFSWMGVWCEGVIMDSLPTNSQRQLVEGYLAHKWGFDALLPADHPYKTQAP